MGCSLSPDVDVSLHVEVVEVVGVLHLAKVRALEPLDDLRLHHPGDVSGQQGQEQALLRRKKTPVNTYIGTFCTNKTHIY